MLDSSKLKEFVDDNFKFDENSRKLSRWVENTAGKGELALYEQFLLFSPCFQKACFPGPSKGVIVWEWVNPFPNKPWFLHVCSTKILKTLLVKEKLLVMSNFSFSHSVFETFWRTSRHFHQFWNCLLQTISVWKSLKFAFWDRLKSLFIRALANSFCELLFCADWWITRILRYMICLLFIHHTCNLLVITLQNKCFLGYTGISLSIYPCIHMCTKY